VTRKTKLQLEAEITELREEIRQLRNRIANAQIRDRRNANVIGQIPRAKRQAGFPLKSVFFRDVWPVVLEAYLATKKAAP
jgi:DNA-binding protein H-NS